MACIFHLMIVGTQAGKLICIANAGIFDGLSGGIPQAD
jgi:hypothetical protein